MKKILFLIDTLGGGGAEKVLCDIVKNLDKTKYDITVSTVWDEGIYIEEIKKYAKYKTIFKKTTPSDNIIIKLINIFKINFRQFIVKYMSPNILYKLLIKDNYDVEIAFLEVLSHKIISGSNNKEAMKYTWIHTDLEVQNWASRFYRNKKKQADSYKKFQKIICVSEDVKLAFEKVFDIKENVSVKMNPINEKQILLKSKETIDDMIITSVPKVISVGRLIEVKGYDRLLIVHKNLINEGIKHELWILGEGEKKKELEEYIIKNNISDSVKILGFKTNPYKYIKQADIFTCSSIREGFSTVVVEAIILNKPIVTTDCSGMKEILGESEYGMIVENSIEGLYKGLKSILSDSVIYDNYKLKARKRGSYFNLANSIKEIEDIIDQEKQLYV